MNPFEILGIPPDADAVAIKRAYSKLLRQHRPDEDPVGFQRVHEAYQACLAYAQQAAFRRQTQASAAPSPAAAAQEAPIALSQSVVSPTARAANDSMPASPQADAPTAPSAPAAPSAERPTQTEPLQPLATPQVAPEPRATPPAPPPRPAPAPTPHPIARPAVPVATRNVPAPQTFRFSLPDFVNELCEQDQGGRVVLQSWLQASEPLYALGLKQAITAPLIQTLAQRPHPMSPDGVSVVLDFFGLNLVSPERRVLEGAILQLESRSKVAWAIRRSSRTTTDPQKNPGSRPTSWLDRFVAGEFQTPLHFFRRATILVVPGFRRRMLRILAGIPPSIDQSKDPMIDQGALKFWREALDPRYLSKWRVVSMCARIAMFALVIGLVSWDASLALAYAVAGLFFLFGWMLLAFNDARRLRKGVTPRRGLFGIGSSGPAVGRGGGIAWWRWLIWIIVAANIVSHTLQVH